MLIVRNQNRSSTIIRMKKHWQLYLVILVPLLYIIMFKYVPMAGVQIAFKNYNFKQGIWGSDWIGFKHFASFLKSPNFSVLIKNTLGISLYALLLGFPIPILLALALNEVGSKFRRFVQTITFAPFFISIVVMVSLLLLFLSPDLGLINKILNLFGFSSIHFMGEASYFKTIYVLSGIWQGMGYGAVIYIAALAGINPELYDSAKVDGASRWHKIWNVDLPGIMPTVVILLILEVGQLMRLGFEKVILMQNSLNLESSEIIATYVYKVGLLGANFSFSTAVGLFNSVVNLILILLVNAIAKRVSSTSLW